MSYPLGGMTVNERLAELGLFDEWDEAAHSRNVEKMKEILLKCGLSEEYAMMSIEKFLENPKKYGF